MCTILVVDDIAQFRQQLASALRKQGYDTVCAASGEEAMNAVRAKQPNLILLDMHMPEMNGVEVLCALRRHVHYKYIPVVLMSDIGERDDILHARKLGVTDYLIKSQLSDEVLLAYVRQHLPNDKSNPVPG